MSDKLSMKLRVSKVGITQELGANAFRKRELFGRDESSQYPQDWKIEFVQDKVSLLDDVLEETTVTVHYNLRSKKVVKEGKEDMYFSSLQGWKIDV